MVFLKRIYYSELKMLEAHILDIYLFYSKIRKSLKYCILFRKTV